jgi:DNA-binding CsgD family transcriptional regulator
MRPSHSVERLSIPSVLLSPEFEIVGVSDSSAAATLTRPNEIIGRPMFDVSSDNSAVPESQNASRLQASPERTLRRRAADDMPLTRYDVRDRAGVFVERRWKPSNRAALDAPRGDVAFLLHTVRDDTGSVLCDRAMVAVAPGAFEALDDAVGEHFVDTAWLVDPEQAATGPGPQSRFQTRLDSLTHREKEVLTLAVQGKVSKVIAFDLGISRRTVEVHRSNILKKMGVSNFLELARRLDTERAADDGDRGDHIRLALRGVLEGNAWLVGLCDMIEKIHTMGHETKEAVEILEKCKKYRLVEAICLRFAELRSNS